MLGSFGFRNELDAEKIIAKVKYKQNGKGNQQSYKDIKICMIQPQSTACDHRQSQFL